MTRTPTRLVYVCTRCQRSITLHIKPSVPPTCDCRRGRAVTVMVQKEA